MSLPMGAERHRGGYLGFVQEGLTPGGRLWLEPALWEMATLVFPIPARRADSRLGRSEGHPTCWAVLAKEARPVVPDGVGVGFAEASEGCISLAGGCFQCLEDLGQGESSVLPGLDDKGYVREKQGVDVRPFRFSQHWDVHLAAPAESSDGHG